MYLICAFVYVQWIHKYIHVDECKCTNLHTRLCAHQVKSVHAHTGMQCRDHELALIHTRVWIYRHAHMSLYTRPQQTLCHEGCVREACARAAALQARVRQPPHHSHLACTCAGDSLTIRSRRCLRACLTVSRHFIGCEWLPECI